MSSTSQNHPKPAARPLSLPDAELVQRYRRLAQRLAEWETREKARAAHSSTISLVQDHLAARLPEVLP